MGHIKRGEKVKMRILVTGANGYLGRGIVKQLLDNGNEVIGAGFSTENIDSRAEKKAVDIFKITDPYNFFGKPDVVLHLAWRDGFVHYSSSHIEDLPKHYLFLKKMVDSGVKKVVGMGSMHEIGFFEGSIDENTACNPLSLYGVGKDALRNCVEVMTMNKKTIWQWLRGYYIVGRSETGSSIFSKLVKASKNGNKEFPFTLGQNQFDFIDYQDFCEQVAAAVGQNEINGIINICSGKPEKLSTRVEKFIQENSLSIKLQYGAFPDRPYDSKAVWGNNEKIMKILQQKKYLD
jgi:dTDP-6-deoxy-L-talose 4-dehydrogenase (NAD+)